MKTNRRAARLASLTAMDVPPNGGTRERRYFARVGSRYGKSCPLRPYRASAVHCVAVATDLFLFAHGLDSRALLDAVPPACRMPAGVCASGAVESPSTQARSEEHTSELQSRLHLVCRLLLEKKK